MSPASIFGAGAVLGAAVLPGGSEIAPGADGGSDAQQDKQVGDPGVDVFHPVRAGEETDREAGLDEHWPVKLDLV